MSWERYQDTNTKVVFIHLLLKACFDQCRHKNISLSRGQYCTSISGLADELNLSPRNVRTALKKLQDSGEIAIETTNKYSIISVQKYEDYQLLGPPADTVRVRTQQTKSSNEFSDKCMQQQDWLDAVCMQNQTTKLGVQNALNIFNLHLKATDKEKSNIRDYKEHFNNWLRYNKKELVAKDGEYAWQWKGQALKTGTLRELEQDKKLFDHPGFEFEIVRNGS